MEKFLIEPKNKYFEIISSFADQEIFVGPAVRFTKPIQFAAIETFRNANSCEGVKLSFTSFLVRALAITLQEFPYANRRVVIPIFNSFFGLRTQRFFNSDIAVAAESKIQPCESFAFFDVLRQAENLTLAETNLWLKKLSLADRTNNEQLNSFCSVVERYPVWLSKIILGLPKWFPSLWVRYRGGAAMVNSFAKYGVDQLSATWLFPIVVGFGHIKEITTLDAGVPVNTKVGTLFMTFDRRTMSGAKAAKVFNRLVELLETCPSTMTTSEKVHSTGPQSSQKGFA